MLPSDFWLQLERRLCRELAADPARRWWWCDGFIPETLEAGRCTGRVWMVNGQQQESWTFTLLLPASANTDEPPALPPELTPGWLQADPAARTLTLDARP